MWHDQWRRNRGFRRFDEPGPPSSWGPEWWGHRKILGKILRKIIKIVATRWRILRLKCTKFDFGWDFAPGPAGGAYSAPPDLLAGFGGQLRGSGRGWAGEEEVKGRGRGGRRKGRGGKGRAPKLLLNQGPSEPCYATGRVTSVNNSEHRCLRPSTEVNETRRSLEHNNAHAILTVPSHARTRKNAYMHHPWLTHRSAV